jgi:hypothetical protein
MDSDTGSARGGRARSTPVRDRHAASKLEFVNVHRGWADRSEPEDSSGCATGRPEGRRDVGDPGPVER